VLKAFITTLSILFSSVAIAQSVPHNHSLYDTDCCQLSECRPVTCDQLRPQSDGSIHFNGIKADKIRPAKNDQCAVCATSTAVYCVYIRSPEG